MLARIAPLLVDRGVQFKAPRSLTEVSRINSGIFYGYTQIGKIITIYPPTWEEAVFLAKRLEKLTRGYASPAVPFDLKYSSNVYYRFGAFTHFEIHNSDGSSTPAMINPQGDLVPDIRTSENFLPQGLQNPFECRKRRVRRPNPKSPLAQYRVFRALAQRGKGGVYQAADFTFDRPRLCLLKEGRKNGETSWDGRDGATRVRHEHRVLSILRLKGLDVPNVYSAFKAEGNYYLVTEFIEGCTLHELLLKRKVRLTVSRAIEYGLQLSKFFAEMHAIGWVWRDCKPMNLMVTPDGRLRPLDFEGATPVGRPDPMLWGTPGFTPPEWRRSRRQTGVADDFYALGALLYLLLTGRTPDIKEAIPLERLRKNIPLLIRKLVMRLLDSRPAQRPTAVEAAVELTDYLNSAVTQDSAIGRE